jgi:phage recombination protein Bet
MSNDLAVKEFSASDIDLIRQVSAPKCTDSEFRLLLYQAKTLGLDPLTKQIWAVKYTDTKPASIFVGRDGLLQLAHRSGAFDGMESGTKMEGTELIGWAKVYRKDMRVAFSVEVSAKEYNHNQGTWLTHPKTMIQKVAEAQALRRAFQISGVYSPEEMPEQEKPPMRDITPDEPKGKMKKAPVHIHSPIIDAEATHKE